jgi:hypothetical protein
MAASSAVLASLATTIIEAVIRFERKVLSAIRAAKAMAHEILFKEIQFDNPI